MIHESILHIWCNELDRYYFAVGTQEFSFWTYGLTKQHKERKEKQHKDLIWFSAR
jgi:hypothetical protein